MFDCTCIDKYGNTVTNLTQWDMNQTLYIEDYGFSTPPQFHFCNKNSEKALVVQSTINNGVLEVVVPNALLTEPYTITAYVYLSEGESSKTVEYVQLPVRSRPQPDSFEYEDNVVIIDVQELANEIRALNASMSEAEEIRVNAENIRISKETDRQSAEEVRKTAETSRISAEIERINAENTRKENEDTRVENENVRTSSEQSRISAETERINKENIRQENEATRQTAETDRINAETDRIEAESIRTNAETERVENESNRVDAESARITAENERISAEAIRQSQETARQTNTATAITNAEAATERANVAAEACEGIIEGTGLIPSTEKGYANGVATLDENALIPVEQLPDIDAKTIDGHEAEYFQERNGDGHLRQAFDANTFTNSGRYTHGVADLGTNIPCTGVFIVENCGTFILQRVISYDIPPRMYVRVSTNNGSTWGAWSDKIVTYADLTAELAKYLPLTGGTVNGALIASATENNTSRVRAMNANRSIDLIAGSAYAGLYEPKSATWISYIDDNGNIIHKGTASGNVPLNGASMISADDTTPIRLKNKTGDKVYLQCVGNNGALGYFGFKGANNPIVIESDASTVHNIIHTGNMADHVLPKTGGEATGIIKARVSNEQFPLRAENASAKKTSIAYFGQNSFLGALGFSDYTPSYTNAIGKDFTIHHDGNSAKVHIGTTAPSDTTGNVLFINTSA